MFCGQINGVCSDNNTQKVNILCE